MLDGIKRLLTGKQAPRPDLACPACGADNAEHATRCKACGKTLDNLWRRDMAQLTRDYDDGFNSGVFIMRQADSCPTCKALQGVHYKPWELPRLPVEECTHPQGCRCVYTPLTKVSLGVPGFGFRARRRDWEERQREKRDRLEKEVNAQTK